MSPAPSRAIPFGLCSSAAVAGPPSPANPWVPLPTTVVMMPLVSMRRMRESRASLRYTSPAASNTIPVTPFTCAAVAGPPSPSELPPPATLTRLPLESILRISDSSPMYSSPAGSTATEIGFTSALTAGPPVPVSPATPVPAMVVMIPVAASTLRTRALSASTT